MDLKVILLSFLPHVLGSNELWSYHHYTDRSRFFQVVRHVSGATYELVHEFTTTVTQPGIQHIPVKQEAWVRAGDIIALYTGVSESQRMVPYDSTRCTSFHPVVLYVKHKLPLPLTMVLRETGCRTYSIVAEYIREYYDCAIFIDNPGLQQLCAA